MPELNNAQAILDAATRFAEVETLTITRGNSDEATFLSVPEGRTILGVKQLLDLYLPHPERRTGTSLHTTLNSFIASTDRFKDEGTAIFLNDLDRSKPVMVAVFDYHEHQVEGGHARFGQHRAQYDFPLSDEWTAWTEADGAKMSQTDFAEFLEDRIADVLAPESAGPTLKAHAATVGINLATPARLLELSKGLAVSVDKRVAQAVNLSTGESQFNFVETHNDKDGAPLKVPNGFAIGVPVFRNGVRYPVPVRLRYRITGGSVVWTISLSNTDKYFEDAISEAAELVADKTTLPVFRGRPE